MNKSGNITGLLQDYEKGKREVLDEIFRSYTKNCGGSRQTGCAENAPYTRCSRRRSFTRRI